MQILLIFKFCVDKTGNNDIIYRKYFLHKRIIRRMIFFYREQTSTAERRLRKYL